MKSTASKEPKMEDTTNLTNLYEIMNNFLVILNIYSPFHDSNNYKEIETFIKFMSRFDTKITCRDIRRI